jgi:phospholipid/cholesterol/gamma-HCH transport system substrate-binding protein
MRSRTFKQGSVGLLIIFTGLLFVGGVIWLKRIKFTANSYTIDVTFQNANGLREGGSVFYRGFEIGRIIGVQSGANGIDVKVEITQPDLRIPYDTILEANQGGLIGETTLNLVPQSDVASLGLSMDPLDQNNCDSNVIICNGDMLKGQVGSSFNELVRTSTLLSEQYSKPIFAENVNATLANTALAAKEIAGLSQELARLSASVRQEIGAISTTANAFTQIARETSNELSLTVNQFSNTAKKYGDTAEELTQLVNNMNSLVYENRSTLVSTLNNISGTSNELKNIMASLSPMVAEFSASLDPADINNLINNLETLTANAAVASGNLKDVSARLNDSTNLVMLQQTLDSARVTFSNTQKITSDLDELTGNPEFRNNLLRLVNGLSSLVSSTDQLENQIQVVQVLESQQEALQIQQQNIALNTQNSPSQNIKKVVTQKIEKQEDELIFAPTSPDSNNDSLSEPILEKK